MAPTIEPKSLNMFPRRLGNRFQNGSRRAPGPAESRSSLLMFFWPPLGRSCALLGRSWGGLGTSWAAPGPSWAAPGGSCWPPGGHFFEAFGRYFWRLGPGASKFKFCCFYCCSRVLCWSSFLSSLALLAATPAAKRTLENHEKPLVLSMKLLGYAFGAKC